MRTIETDADIAEGLACLAKADRRLRKVIRTAGPVPLRRRENGFGGLARIICAQQLSVASATAIWARFEAACPGCPPAAIAAASDDAIRATGMSAPKIRALHAAATACLEGLDFNELAALPAAEAHGRLTAIKGIGPWTADIYLLFCLGHPDIFPVGDLALRYAVADAFALEGPIAVDSLAGIAETWSPWRGVAALLFWAYFHARKQKGTIPV